MITVKILESGKRFRTESSEWEQFSDRVINGELIISQELYDSTPASEALVPEEEWEAEWPS